MLHIRDTNSKPHRYGGLEQNVHFTKNCIKLVNLYGLSHNQKNIYWPFIRNINTKIYYTNNNYIKTVPFNNKFGSFSRLYSKR